MALRTKVLVAAALAALLLLFPGPTPRAEEGPYPVWWSPDLELASLNEIDERLARKLWPDGGGIEVYKEEYQTREEKIVDTCLSAFDLRQQGYYGRGNNNHKLLLYHLAKCRAIEMLGNAKPARASYVSDFVLDEKAIEYLPAMASIAPSCEGRCWQYEANKRRIPWSKVGSFLSIDVKSPREFIVETEGWRDWIEILARADFNGDGFEDILLVNTNGATQGTYGATDIFLLGREGAESVMWVLDAERYLCPKYQCDSDYDFSEIFR